MAEGHRSPPVGSETSLQTVHDHLERSTMAPHLQAFQSVISTPCNPPPGAGKVFRLRALEHTRGLDGHCYQRVACRAVAEVPIGILGALAFFSSRNNGAGGGAPARCSARSAAARPGPPRGSARLPTSVEQRPAASDEPTASHCCFFRGGEMTSARLSSPELSASIVAKSALRSAIVGTASCMHSNRGRVR